MVRIWVLVREIRTQAQGLGGKPREAMAQVRCHPVVAKEKWTLDWCVETPIFSAGVGGQGPGSAKTRSGSCCLPGVMECLISRPHGV